MDSTTLISPSGSRLSQYIALTKPRVTQLAVFCAVIGMFLSTPGMVPWTVLIGGTVGIWLLAGAAFAINCLMEQKIDAMMRRTAWRPSARGEITPAQILLFSAVLGAAGMWTLYTLINALTMWLTIATFVGYAVIYTVFAETGYAAEHRHWWRVRRHAAGSRLGGGTRHVPATRGSSYLSSSSGRLRISGHWRCTDAKTTRTPACRCCRTRMARNTRVCIFFCTP